MVDYKLPKVVYTREELVDNIIFLVFCLLATIWCIYMMVHPGIIFLGGIL